MRCNSPEYAGEQQQTRKTCTLFFPAKPRKIFVTTSHLHTSGHFLINIDD